MIFQLWDVSFFKIKHLQYIYNNRTGWFRPKGGIGGDVSCGVEHQMP